MKDSINNIVRANNTYVYLKKDPSIFEEENFNQLLEIARTDRVAEEINEKSLIVSLYLEEKKFEAIIKLKNEKSICTELLFKPF